MISNELDTFLAVYIIQHGVIYVHYSTSNNTSSINEINSPYRTSSVMGFIMHIIQISVSV